MGRPRGSSGGGSTTPKSVGLRRRSGSSVMNPILLGYGVELMMECDDDALSTSQFEDLKKQKEEYKKAIKNIEAAKAAADAANAAAAKAAADAVNAAAAAAAATVPPFSTPPVSNGSRTSPDIMIVGETPPQKKPALPPQQFVTPHAVAASLPMSVALGLPPGAMVPAPINVMGQTAMSGGIVPGQMFRLVNSTSSQQANQWFLRPMVPTTLPPQQQVLSQPHLQLGQLGAAGLAGSTVVSGTSGLGIKRPFNFVEYQPVTPPVAKKSRSKQSSESETGGNWVPLDEYYYGKMEGDPTYTEDKAEFRFKCWMCTKMLYNNIKAMMHLQGHLDSEKQQHLDLNDLTQCKHCYKTFDTPFEMQTHIEKVHLQNLNVLMCRICEKDLESRGSLTAHMRQNHCACEMPYVCQLCNFRSSMYSDVVDHFKKKHDSCDSMLCLYCLRVFHVKFVAQGWGQTQTFYAHLLRHQSKSSNKKCTFCKLSFFNSADMKQHRKTHHQPNQKGVLGLNQGSKYSAPDQVMIRLPEAGLSNKAGLKSLNAPTSSKVAEHRGLRLPYHCATSHCMECKMLMNTLDHYKKYIQCSMCRFATSCGFGYATHMLGFHSGQSSAVPGSIPTERPLSTPLFCICGFTSNLGNKIANHLVFCTKRTCYLNKLPEPKPLESVSQADLADPRHKPEASILDILGLVKKPLPSSSDGEEGVAVADDLADIRDTECTKEKREESADSPQAEGTGLELGTPAADNAATDKQDTDTVQNTADGEKEANGGHGSQDDEKDTGVEVDAESSKDKEDSVAMDTSTVDTSQGSEAVSENGPSEEVAAESDEVAAGDELKTCEEEVQAENAQGEKVDRTEGEAETSTMQADGDSSGPDVSHQAVKESLGNVEYSHLTQPDDTKEAREEEPEDAVNLVPYDDDDDEEEAAYQVPEDRISQGDGENQDQTLLGVENKDLVLQGDEEKDRVSGGERGEEQEASLASDTGALIGEQQAAQPLTHAHLGLENIQDSGPGTPLADEQSAAGTPLTDEPTAGTPLDNEPAPGTPLADEPALGTPLADEPALGTPLDNEPALGTPLADEPAPGTPLADEPAPGTPLADEPALGTPLADEPAPETPLADEPAPGTPLADEVAVGTPVADERPVEVASEQQLPSGGEEEWVADKLQAEEGGESNDNNQAQMETDQLYGEEHNQKDQNTAQDGGQAHKEDQTEEEEREREKEKEEREEEKEKEEREEEKKEEREKVRKEISEQNDSVSKEGKSNKEGESSQADSYDTGLPEKSYNDSGSYRDSYHRTSEASGDQGYVDKGHEGQGEGRGESSSGRQEEAESRWRENRPEDGAMSQDSYSSGGSRSHSSDRDWHHSKDRDRSYDRHRDYRDDRYDRDRGYHDRDRSRDYHDRHHDRDRHYDRHRDQRNDRNDRQGGSSRDRDRYSDQYRQGGNRNDRDRNYHRGYY